MTTTDQNDTAVFLEILREISFLREENERLRRAHINNRDSLKDPDSDEASRLARDIHWSSSAEKKKYAFFKAYQLGREMQFKERLDYVSAQDHALVDGFLTNKYGGASSDYEFSRVLLKLIKLGRKAEAATS